MKILIAAAICFFMAAAADARHTAPENNPPHQTLHSGLGEYPLASANETGNKGASNNKVESTTYASRKGLLKIIRFKKDRTNPKSVETNSVLQDQNPAQNPADRPTGVDQAKPPQEVKAIPKARRVDRPAKVEGSAKRPEMGSAKRGNPGSARPNAAAAKPDRPTNPNQVNRAGRPTGGGRPDHAGRPDKGKGKD